jgi:hypothetical protein
MVAQRNSGTKSHPKRKRVEQRKRKVFRFVLDYKKNQEAWIGEWLESLTKYHLYLPTMRDAISLFMDLKAGNLDLIYKMFPDVVRKIQARTASDQFNAILAELETLRAQGGQGRGQYSLTSGNEFEDVVITVSDAPAKRATAEEVAVNIVSEMGNLFDE